MIRTSWIECKTNEAVLNEVNERRTMINKIMKSKMELIGHLIRHNEFITIIKEGKINGKRTRERLRRSFFEEIFYRMDFASYQKLKRAACDRHEWLK